MKKSPFATQLEDLIVGILVTMPFPVSRWQLWEYIKDIEFQCTENDLANALRRLEYGGRVRCPVRTVGHGLEKLYAKRTWGQK